MTGTERLRDFAWHMKDFSVWPGGQKLLDIADQIERERACDSDTAENVSLVVGGVVDEMERLLSGHEVRGNNPVSRWSRELREALDARHDHAEDVSVSAYDLLPQDEREAIAWVREHGGLSHVKDICHDFRAVVERLGIEWSESELHGLMDVLDKRLMPEGMEGMIASYPRFEDGTPALTGMEAVANSGQRSGEAFIVKKAWFENDSWHLSDSTSDGHYWHFKHKDHVVRRPAPKVLDADGAEIRVGDTVWFKYDLNINKKYTVTKIENNCPLPIICIDEDGVESGFYSSGLSHRAPVLAADGRPLREGETVWDTKGNGPYNIQKIENDGVIRIDGSSLDYFGSDFVHERPDSWERIEADVMVDAKDYCESRGISPKYPKHSGKAKCEDLVRRCRALTERGQ